jgi:flagellar biosynthesis/type III secretory pathway protein FliH
MTFDDQLRRTFDTMSERLHAAVDRQVEIVVEEISAAAQAERERAVSDARDGAAREATGGLESAVAAARQEAHEEGLAAGKDQGRREALEEGLAAGKDQGRREGLEEGLAAGMEKGRREGVEEGLAAGTEKGHREGLEEGLAAGNEKGHHGGLEEGRQRGFDEGRQQGVLEGRRQAEEESRKALDAAVASAPVERPAATGDTDRLAESVRALAGARSFAEILETLVSRVSQESGQASVWIIRGGRLRHWRPTGIDEGEPYLPLDDPGPIAAAARTNAVAAVDGTLAVPIAMAGQVVAVLFTTAGATSSAIEIMARYAARCLEALTAFKAARALTGRPGEPDAEGRAASGEAIVEEDESARRYARLLVSEIKLYHEGAVVDGRRDRDLATRLGGEIARARVLYEQRVPPQVRQRADYFHDELVRTLADGDATLLQLT